MSTLEGMVKTLARRRAEQKVALDALDKATGKYNAASIQLPEHAALLKAQEAADNASATLSEADEKLRAAAIEQYEKDENKHPTPGVSLKINKKYEIDMKEAAAWAKTNAPGCFVLDKKKYQQVALDLEGPITITEVPVVLIDRDLSRLLEEYDGTS